jgi:hypothetical protein
MKKTQRIADELQNGRGDFLFDKDALELSTMERAERLSDGDEYFDLEKYAHGVCGDYGT